MPTKKVVPSEASENVETTPAATILEEEVTIEKTSDGVIEVKKHEVAQGHSEEISIEQLSLIHI